ncbi:MAG: NfeD family protein [Candidatus Thorarchaeota archaeon]
MMDAWIKIFVVLLLMSLLSVLIGYVLFNPFVGLILVSIVLTLMVVAVEPASGKAMAQVVVPIVLILFAMQVFFTPGFTVDIVELVVIAGMLFLMLAIFTGGGGFVDGGFIDAKVTCKLFPFYGVAILLSVLVDPTRTITVYLMVGTVMGLMVLYGIFLRGYDKWPEFSEYDKMHDVIAISDINPIGKVKAGAAIWRARTDGPPISKGESVSVRGITGLTMIVGHEAPGESNQR